METVVLMIDSHERTLGVHRNQDAAVLALRDMAPTMAGFRSEKLPGGYNIRVGERLVYKIREVRVKG
jgi:hypothetical protein